MLKLSVRRPNSGMTLIELIISIGITALMFGALGYMIFVSGRNSFLVRDQSLSQTNAAAATERVTNTLRNARALKPYGSDSMSTTQTRLLYETPNAAAGGGIQTGVVVFVPPTNSNSSDGIVKIFEKATDYKPGTVKTDKATYQYPNVQSMSVLFHSNSWVTFGVSYSYRGFSLSTTDEDKDGLIDSRLAGEFITDVIAKNHHPGESAHYAETTTTIFQL